MIILETNDFRPFAILVWRLLTLLSFHPLLPKQLNNSPKSHWYSH